MNYHVHLWSECLGPCTHMRGVEGNHAQVAREDVITPRGKMRVPCISGNSLRHVLVRGPGGKWLLNEIGLEGKTSLEVQNFFIHGGNNVKTSGREDLNRLAEMYDLFPLLRLLGGTLEDQITKGRLIAKSGSLVCQENRTAIMRNVPEKWKDVVRNANLLPAEYYVGGYQYTRGDEKRNTEVYSQQSRELHTSDPEIDNDKKQKSNLGLITGESVIRGAIWSHGFVINGGSRLDYGCLLHAISQWQDQTSAIGGMSAKGHGRVYLSILGGDHEDQEKAIEEYVQFVEDNAERMRNWIEKTFAKISERAVKKAENAAKKAGKKKTATVEPATEQDQDSGMFGDAGNE